MNLNLIKNKISHTLDGCVRENDQGEEKRGETLVLKKASN